MKSPHVLHVRCAVSRDKVAMIVDNVQAVCECFFKQETFEKCWAHSSLPAAARRITIRYCRVARRLRIDVHDDDDDDNDNA